MNTLVNWLIYARPMTCSLG